MKKYTKIAIVSLLAGTVSACSSDNSDDPVSNNVVPNTTTTAGMDDDPAGSTDTGTTTNGVPTVDTDTGSTAGTAGTSGQGTSTTGATAGTGTSTGTAGATDTATDTGTSGATTTAGTGTTDAASTTGTAGTTTQGTAGTTDASGATATAGTATAGTEGTADTTATAGTTTDGTAGTTDASGATATAGTTTEGTAGTTDAATAGTTTEGTATEGTAGTTTEGTDGTGSTDGSSTGGDSITPSGRSELGNPPTLADPFADPIPSPNSADPFGADLEVDPEEPIAGGAPTTPKFLRVDLVSNDWAEINWAKSNDDEAVVEYRIYRSDKTDGPTYIVREDTTSPSSGTQDEINKIWRTTSFIDCNYTRFNDSVHNCDINGPSPGDKFSYQVTAVDADGQESPRSNTITITYHAESNAPVPKYNDFYKRQEDTFAQDHDLSDTSYFLDKFSMVFEDNFDGPAIDSTKWQTGLTWGDTRIINGEQQYFVNTQDQPGFGYDPFKFENGDLVIEAIKTPIEFVDSLPPVCDEVDPFGVDRCQFLSGALSSHDKFGMTYGYVEGRMKVGSVSGMLSSFYMYHRYPGTEKNLHGPEIDIVEYLGENPFGDEDAFQTYHFRDTADGEIIRSAPTMSYKKPDGGNYSDDYHTFGVLWEPQLVIWYIDGKEIKRLSGPQVSRQQMNIVTYLVAGSAWAPTPADDTVYPLQYKIDYIRAYQRPEYSNNGVYPGR